MAEVTYSISMRTHVSSPCKQGSKVSAETARLWALSREEGEDRSWGHASPRACVPQFLKNKPCCCMKCNQVPRQTVPRAYKASNSCLPPAVTHLGHRVFIFIIIIIRPAPSAMVWLAHIHTFHIPLVQTMSSRMQASLILSSPWSWDANTKEQKHPRVFPLYLANIKTEKPTLSHHSGE